MLTSAGSATLKVTRKLMQEKAWCLEVLSGGPCLHQYLSEESLGSGKYSFHTQSWRPLLRARKPEALTRGSLPYKDLVKEGTGGLRISNGKE